jgi:hypothetical protein
MSIGRNGGSLPVAARPVRPTLGCRAKMKENEFMQGLANSYAFWILLFVVLDDQVGRAVARVRGPRRGVAF